MLGYILGIVQGIVSSAVFAWISKVYSERHTDEVSNKSAKFIKNAKREFYISFGITLFLTALPTYQYQIINDAIRALTFISLGFVLMGFMCIFEVSNAVKNDSTNSNSSDIS